MISKGKARFSMKKSVCGSLNLALVSVLSAGLCLTAAATHIDMCEHVTIRNSSTANPYASWAWELRQGVCSMCRSAGVEYVRTDFAWRYCEPSKGNWNWTAYDAAVAAAEAEGVKLLPILCYNSIYSGKQAFQELDNWTNYVRRVVSRYKSHFTAVEVWNEPNLNGSWRSGEPANVSWKNADVNDYITLLKATHQAVKAVDPNIQVVMGGIAGRCDSFFKTLCSDAKDWFDIVAFHPYNNEHAPDFTKWNTCPGSNGMVDEYLSAMSDKGVSKPVWITEIGWPTHGGGQSEANQSSYLTQFISHCASKNIPRVFVYEFRAPERDEDDQEEYFGVVHADLTLKPAFTALAKQQCGSAWTNPYAGYEFLAACDDTAESSVTGAVHWSSHAVPSSAKDYLVDLGLGFPMNTPSGAAATFAGRTLTLGRVGAETAALVHRGTDLTVSGLRLANGEIVVAGGGTAASRRRLLGTATVQANAAAPFAVVAKEAASFGRWSGTVSGEAGTGLRFAAEGTGATLDAVCDFDGSAYHGSLVAKGSGTTLRLASSALARSGGMLADSVVLRDGARLAPIASGDVLQAAARGLKGEGGAAIFVGAGETMTLKAAIGGTFSKTGGGALTLDLPSGSTGRVDLKEGTLVVAGALAANAVGAVAGDTAIVMGQGLSLAASGPFTATAAKPVRIQLTGSVAAAGTAPVLTLPASSGAIAAGSVVVTCSTAPRLKTAMRIETAGGVQTVYLDTVESSDYSVAADSFEPYAAETAAKDLPGWSGTGSVQAQDVVMGDPPSYPLQDESHFRTLAVRQESVRDYDANVAGDNQSVDLLVEVVRRTRPLPTAVEMASSRQLAVLVDSNGWFNVWHPDSKGVGHWTPLSFGTSSAFDNGAFVRVTLVMDYQSGDEAFGQVRVNGSCGVLWDVAADRLSAEGVRSPKNPRPNGSWFRLFSSAAAAKKVSRVRFTGYGQVDDVVLGAHDKSGAPQFDMGSVTSVEYESSMGLVTIPFSRFDDVWGLSRDPYADADGDGFTNGEELSCRSNPLDPNSVPRDGLLLIIK